MDKYEMQDLLSSVSLKIEAVHKMLISDEFEELPDVVKNLFYLIQEEVIINSTIVRKFVEKEDKNV